MTLMIMPSLNPSINLTGIITINSAGDLKNLLEILVIIIAGVWALYKIQEFRDFKHWIQFDIDANIYPLKDPITTDSYSWDENGKRHEKSEPLDHILEILFKFNNKGKTRVKLYNIQALIFTLTPDAKLNPEEGHLDLDHPIKGTGNIVPKDVQFYYIEPQVDQIITYLTLVEKPNKIIKIWGKFCLDNKRIYPKREKGRKYFTNEGTEKEGLIEKEFLLLKIFNSISYCLCDKLKERKVLSWDNINSNVKASDEEKLINYITKNYYDINNPRINKIEEDAIKIFADKKIISLKIKRHKNKKIEKIILEITNYDRDHRITAKREMDHRLIAKEENGKINIYEKERYDLIYGWILRAIYNRHCRRLLSHTAERTFFVDSEGCIIKEPSAAELKFNTQLIEY